MKYALYLALITLMSTSELCSQTETCLQNINNPNNHIISQTIDSETIIREYILHVPINYDENIPTPLVINLHGFGDCASDYSETIGGFYNFSELANEENFIVAYPQGAYRPEKEDTYWEPGEIGTENIYENDVYFIEELISSIGAEFNLDPEMIYACGYSNGGMMAYSLACNRSSVFSAIGIMSGTMLEEDCTLEVPVPIIKFHGIADGVLPYEGSVWYQSVEEVVNYWLILNGIAVSSNNSFQLNGGKVILDEYSGGNNNSCLSLYTIHEEYDKPGDHVWFSDKIEGDSPNRLMWNFFKNNCGVINSTNEPFEEKYTVHPNPVENQLVIKNAIDQIFSLYNLNGKLVLRDRIISNSEIIDLENLPSGYYTIRIGSEINRFFKVD